MTSGIPCRGGSRGVPRSGPGLSGSAGACLLPDALRKTTHKHSVQPMLGFRRILHSKEVCHSRAARASAGSALVVPPLAVVEGSYGEARKGFLERRVGTGPGGVRPAARSHRG